MEIKELTCINCPLGCQLRVEMEGKEILSISGNTCKRGEVYARKELVSPTRTVTSTAAVRGGIHPVVAVKTARDIPKDKIFEVMAEINKVTASAPIKIGDVIIENVCGTGVDVVAAANLSRH